MYVGFIESPDTLVSLDAMSALAPNAKPNVTAKTNVHPKTLLTALFTTTASKPRP